MRRMSMEVIKSKLTTPIGQALSKNNNIVQELITENHLKNVYLALYGKAIQGDTAAIKVFLERALGQAKDLDTEQRIQELTEKIDSLLSDKLDEEEFEIVD